uniref:Uncharacterized protein n=1 Tax=Tanacetum cinerariifolium TaxID=118510 RepID=A0A6L2KDM0_TANCI|nr:hypothetical protein [Tanacetum cinerariifolium]
MRMLGHPLLLLFYLSLTPWLLFYMCLTHLEATVVVLPDGVLDFVMHSDLEFKPFEAPLSPVHHAIADPKSDPSKAESEEDPSKDDSFEAIEPLST